MNITGVLVNPISNLRTEYEHHKNLYEVQPRVIRLFLDQQAGRIAQAVIDGASRLHYSLPDKIFPAKGTQSMEVPAASRNQTIGGWFFLQDPDLRASLLQHLFRLEHASNEAISDCGILMRYAIARSMVHTILPDGNQVLYRALDGDEIPAQPIPRLSVVGSIHTRDSDSDEIEGSTVPYTQAARSFFLPQWVALDDNDHLLTNSLVEAEAHIRSMQSYLSILHLAVGIDPNIVADEVYQRKRAGILGQLVNQGRKLGRYEALAVIDRIHQRNEQGSLNRGLTLSLSYFDDQAMKMKRHEIRIIPDGRIMFVPAFVVLAVRNEYARIAQDTRLNSSTRKHLISLLALLEKAFLSQEGS